MTIPTTSSSVCQGLTKALRANRKYFILILFLFALFYIPVFQLFFVTLGEAWQARCTYLNSIHDDELEGWPRNGTREMRIFIQPDKVTTLISSSICDGRQPFLLVVVCSSVHNLERRKAIRATWASNLSTGKYIHGRNDMPEDSPKDTFVVFLLGDPDNAALQAVVEEESRTYGDIVQERFIDSYNNLTLKSVMLLKWVTQRCSSALYVMKTDDDTMVNLQSLQVFLRSHQASLANAHLKRTRPLLVGYLIQGARPILDPSHKWYMPRYIYTGCTYPNYLSGSGYVMSQDVVRALYSASQRVSLMPIEDVYITGQCAASAGLRPSGHPGFELGAKPKSTCVSGYPQVITTHRLNPKELRETWDKLRLLAADCKKTAVHSEDRALNLKSD